jgi:uncharacterized membrane protein
VELGIALVAALLFIGTPLVAIFAFVRSVKLARRVDLMEGEIRSLASAAHSAPAAGYDPPASAAPPAVPGASEQERASPPGGERSRTHVTGADIPPSGQEGSGFRAIEIHPTPPDPPRPAPARPAGDLEARLGTRWFNVAGIIVLLFAVAFFLKYAYENSWVGPRGRVAIGIVSGIVAIIIADATRRRGHRVFSQGLTGGGLAALYLSLFSSFRIYGLLGATPVFVMMVVVTAFGVALALLQESLAIAILSFLGGYLTPILLSTGQDAAEILFAYMALLALAALVVTYYRRWRALDILAFAGTVVLYAGWYDSWYQRERLPVALAGLGAFFLIFLVIPYGHSLARRLTASTSDHVLSLANAVFTFGYLYAMIHPISDRALGFVALGLAAAYLVLGVQVRRRSPADRAMAISVFGMSIAFLTIAVPLQAGLYAITLAWAVQGVLLVRVGFRYANPLTRASGLAVLALAGTRLFLRHSPLHVDPFTLFWNRAFGTWSFVAAAIMAAAWLFRRRRAGLGQREGWLPSGLPVAGALLLFTALNREVTLWFRLWELPRPRLAAATMLVWAAFAWILIAAGHRMADRAVRWTGSAIIVFSIVPFGFLVEQVRRQPDFLFGSLVFWAGILGVASWFGASAWHRRHGEAQVGDVPLSRAFAGAGALLLLALMTAEVHSHFLLQAGSPGQTAANGVRALLAVSVLWALFASIVMALGFARSDSAIRYVAAALFALTLLKVFFVDIWELREFYRIVSFAVLGLLLVAASFFYSRFRSRIAKTGAVALLAILATGQVRADFDAAQWERLREIETAGLEGPYVVVTLDREILDRSRADLADLRVIDRAGEEVPWVLWVRAGGMEEVDHPAGIVNRARLAGGEAVAEMRFEGKRTRNRIVVGTNGSSFRRRVLVEGSDDGARWAILEDDGWVYRIPGRGDGESSAYSVVDLPPNDFPRLRVTVFPMADDERTVAIEELRAVMTTERAALTEPLPVERHDRLVDPNRQTTTIEIDFGYRHGRPAALAIDFEEEAFQRPYRILGRNEERIVTQRGRTETGEPILKESEAPWQQLAAGRFRRMPAGPGSRKAVDQSRVRFERAVARYLRVVIEDQDSPPLHIRGIAAEGLVQRIVFPRKAGGAYALHYGQPEARPPHYDLADVLPDLDEAEPAAAVLGAPRDNPQHGHEPEAPFTERNPWLFWLVLLVAALILAAVVFRNVGSAAGTEQG